jgi:hypothetical protein
MTAWVLIYWLGGMVGGPGAIPGIESEAECRALIVKIGVFDRFGRSGNPPPRHECIQYKMVAPK